MPDLLSSALGSSPLSATSASGASQRASLSVPPAITEISCTYTIRNFRDHGLPARAGERGGGKGAPGGEVGDRRGAPPAWSLPPLCSTRDDLPFCRLIRAGTRAGGVDGG